MAHTATGSATELSQPGLDELTSEQAGMASCHPPTFKPEMLADGRKLRGTPFKASPPKPAGELPPPTLAGDQVNPLDAAFRAAVSPWMPLPPPGTPGPAAESTATLLPIEPERRLATVGTPWKAPPPRIDGPNAPPQGIDGPCYRAGPPSKTPPPGMGSMPLPPPGTPGPAAESTATPLPVEPERRLATVGTPWKAPPPEIDGPKAPPQGIDGPCYRAGPPSKTPPPGMGDRAGGATEDAPEHSVSTDTATAANARSAAREHTHPQGIDDPCYRAGPPSKAPPPGMGDRAGGATDHAPEPSASTDTATAADARSAARERTEEIERGLRALRGITKRVGNWDGEVYARLERYRDAVGREWQYDPLAYEWMYVD